jgi:hypothetical protein
MIPVRIVSVLLALALSASLFPGPPAAAASTTPITRASSVKSATLSKLRAMQKKSVSPKKYKYQVATAKAKLSKYKRLLPSGHKLKTSKVRAFRFDKGQVIISFPILTSGYAGGAFSFVFTNKTLKSSEQLILAKTNKGRTGVLRIYTNGKLKVNRSVSTGAVASPLNLWKQDIKSFTDCWNSMPGWMTDLVGFVCTITCLGAETPPTLIVCLVCLVGLGGIYASFALRCANDKVASA